MFLVLKLLHVTAVVLFLGNITTGLFWHAHAARTRDARLLAHALDGIIRSDRWFTVPGVIAITLSGIAMAVHAHLPLLHTPWILGSIVLFSISGLLFVFRVAPLQQRLRNLAHGGLSPRGFEYATYHRLARVWELWGAAALLLPLAAMALMVLKPVR